MRTHKLILISIAFASMQSMAGYPQCAGSYEPEKCNRLYEELSKESPLQRAERIKRAADNKSATDKAVEKQPKYRHVQSTEKPRIGMTAIDAADSSWGRPKDINTTTTATQIRQQWVYGGRRCLYFTNGLLTTIQE